LSIQRAVPLALLDNQVLVCQLRVDNSAFKPRNLSHNWVIWVYTFQPMRWHPYRTLSHCWRLHWKLPLTSRHKCR